MSIDEKIIKIAQEQYDIQKREEQSNVSKVNEFELYPHIFFLSCVVDSGNSDTAWNLIQEISKHFGPEFMRFYDAVKDNNKELNEYLKTVSSRNNDKWFKQAVIKIYNDYDGDVSKLWKDAKNCADIISKCLEFKGVGIKKATMITNILTRAYYEDIKTEDKSSIDISPDIHVKRAMYRLDLVKCESIDDYNKIDSNLFIYKARAINPKFPGLLDFAFWRIGKDKICQNDKCMSGVINERNKKIECPFESFCLKKGI